MGSYGRSLGPADIAAPCRPPGCPPRHHAQRGEHPPDGFSLHVRTGGDSSPANSITESGQLFSGGRTPCTALSRPAGRVSRAVARWSWVHTVRRSRGFGAV